MKLTKDQLLQIQGIRTRLDLIYKEVDKLMRSLPEDNKVRYALGSIHDVSYDQLGFLDDIIKDKLLPVGNTSFSVENYSVGGTDPD
jgi:hypothetical protein